jgi:CDP-diacylglycerol--glycerol-3-phosphate 3-phosphatidyltransferase
MTATGTERRPARFLTVSNLLSLSRALLTIPFVLVMLSPSPGARWWGLAIFVVAMITDRLDGVLARRLDQVTEWGKILDPLADKVGVAGAAVVLLVRGAIPLWFVAALLLRDLLILAGGLVLKARLGVVLPSNAAGKWTVGVAAFTLGLALVGAPSWLLTVGLSASACMLILSLGLYLSVFVQHLKR